MKINTLLDSYYYNHYKSACMTEEQLMKILGKSKCNICNCWVVNFKRHLFTKSHNNAVMKNLNQNYKLQYYV